MMIRQTAIALIFTAPFASMAFAQGVGTEVQRDINQESRIEQGLKSGQLNTGEAAKLERGEARLDRMEKNAPEGRLALAARSRPYQPCAECGIG